MHLTFSSRVEAPPEQVLAFHLAPPRFADLCRGWPGLRLMHAPPRVALGGELWVCQQVAGCIPMVLGFRCVRLEAWGFEDELIHGPFAHFRHVHRFEAAAGGGTVVTDELDFRMALPWGGALATPLLTRRPLTDFFNLRHRNLAALSFTPSPVSA